MRRLRRIVDENPWRLAEAAPVADAEEEKLRALGYLAGGGAERSAEPFAGRDPKDGLAVFKAINARDVSLGTDPAAAVVEIEALLEREPGSARLWTMLGRNRILLGRFDAARAALERAADLNPVAADPPLFLAMCLSELGRPDEAERVLRRLVDRQPQSYRARLTLATVLAARGDRAAAAEEFRRALELNPAGEHARRGLEAMR